MSEATRAALIADEAARRISLAVNRLEDTITRFGMSVEGLAYQINRLNQESERLEAVLRELKQGG